MSNRDNDVALHCSKTSASDAAITAGLSCKRNTGEEPDISQLIEEKTPTRSGETVDINNVVGDSMLPQLTVRARPAVACIADGRAPFIDKVMQAGLDRLVTAFRP